MNAPRAERLEVNGVLLLDKPRGLTSQQAVARVKRLFSARKAGHTGTLDPMADGLLPIGLGEATKFSQFLLDADKGYLASVALGATTTTGDAEGAVLVRRVVTVRADDIRGVLGRFAGEQMQMPPMHSALKVAGKPLYAYARAGIELERKPRHIRIDDIQLVDFNNEIAVIRVLCSKGTYIRVLAEEIGAALGCGAHLSGLTRERAGQYALGDAVSCATLEGLTLSARMACLRPVEDFAHALGRIDLDAAGERRIVSGQVLAMGDRDEGLYRLYGATGAFLGVGELGAGRLSVRRLTRQVTAVAPIGNNLSNPQVTG